MPTDTTRNGVEPTEEERIQAEPGVDEPAEAPKASATAATTTDAEPTEDEPVAQDEFAAEEGTEPPAEEPIAQDEPAAEEGTEPPADEPIAQDEPAAEEGAEPPADEPVAQDELAAEEGAEPLADEPVAQDEPAAEEGAEPPADEPVAQDESAAEEGTEPPADEPVAQDEPAAEDDVEPTEDEPVAQDESAAEKGTEPPAEEAAQAGVEPTEAALQPPSVAEGRADELAAAEGEPPAEEGEAPAVEDESPAVDGESPAVEGEPPAVEGEPPAVEGEAPPSPAGETAAGAPDDGAAGKKKRRRLLATLGVALVLFVLVSITFWRYLRQPAPLPDLLPIGVEVNYPPHYLFSIHGLEQPVGVAWSEQTDRLYVAETGGERLVKILNRNGDLLGSLAPPHTRPAERSPVYVAVDGAGRVFVSDRLQHSIFVYSPEGELLDALLCPDLSLSEYVSEQVGGIEAGTALAYNTFEAAVYYRPPGGDEQALPLPGSDSWAPLGIRLDREGNLLLTDVLAGRHAVRQFPGKVMSAASWQEFEPAEMVFGRFGQDAAELAYPNVAVADSSGRIYVTDGNNGRISVWDRGGQFLFNFGRGVGEGALGLPRGAAMDGRDRLHVVDTVEQKVKVYDVAGSEPEFLFAFGDWGNGDGQFNFPNDISLDRSGRLYIADRENDRIQVWSY